MSDDGLVKVEYTIDGEGKPDGTKWEATLLPTDWQELGWAELAEKIAAEHYESQNFLLAIFALAQSRLRQTILGGHLA